ncbi:hypothetical protein N665_2159s0011 [Sinapis alba]|nr:hypothetical protein N665_2159s0011 [Sinapis alba]
MFPSVCSSKPEEVVNVDVSQAKTLLESDHQYLDVRTEEEFRRGHCFVPKILNVPYMLNSPQGRVKNQDFLDQVSSLLNPTDDILVVISLFSSSPHVHTSPQDLLVYFFFL